LFFVVGLVIFAVAGNTAEIIILLLGLSVFNEVSFLSNLLEAIIVVYYFWSLLQLMLLDLVVKLEALGFLVESLNTNVRRNDC
jgi:hypothetical protein